MGVARIRKFKKGVMLLGCLLAVSVGLVAGPASAQASTSEYCGGWESPNTGCSGAARWLYQAYGWGDQAGVCVVIAGKTEWRCTTHASEGVYSPSTVSNVWAQPAIQNWSNVNNFVHGVALTH